MDVAVEPEKSKDSPDLDSDIDFGIDTIDFGADIDFGDEVIDCGKNNDSREF